MPNNIHRKLISLEERRRREEAVNDARASVQLSGFAISNAEEAHARRYIDGEISLAEFVEYDRERLGG
jgi:hypothetical protein